MGSRFLDSLFKISSGLLVFIIFSSCMTPNQNDSYMPAVQEEIDVIRSVDPGWELEAVVAPPPTASALFCIQAFNGSILVDGPSDRIVKMADDGSFSDSSFPSGGPYFDFSEDGRIWYYHMFKNQLKMFDPASGRMTLLADLPVAHSVGSISVSRDGKKVFITIGQTADGNRSEI